MRSTCQTEVKEVKRLDGRWRAWVLLQESCACYIKCCVISFLQIPVLHSLQSVIRMTSQCYIFSDLNSFKCTDESLGTRLSERSRTFLTELACRGSHRSEACLKRFLETCGSAWIKMHVTDMLLANYSDCLVPLERRPLKSKPLSLEKIVRVY